MARQVQQGRGEGPSTSAAAAAAEARPATDEGGAALRPGDSESSIYTMAASYVSPPTGRAAAAADFFACAMTCWVIALAEGMLGGRCDEVLGGRTRRGRAG